MPSPTATTPVQDPESILGPIRRASVSTTPPPVERLVTPAEAAELLGIVRRTLRRWTMKRNPPLPCVRLSPTCVRYRVSDIIRWAETVGPEVKAPNVKPIPPKRGRSRRPATLATKGGSA